MRVSVGIIRIWGFDRTLSPGSKRLEDGRRWRVEDSMNNRITPVTNSGSQIVLAVQVVQRARPDMTAADALAAVNLARQS